MIPNPQTDLPMPLTRRIWRVLGIVAGAAFLLVVMFWFVVAAYVLMEE